MILRRKHWLVFAALLCGAAILIVTAVSGAAPSQPTTKPDVSAKAGSTNRISSELKAHFALFRKSAVRSRKQARAELQTSGVSEMLSSLPAGDVSPALVSRYGLNLAQTELVQSDSGSVWVVPGSSGVCVTTVLPASAAVTTPMPVTNCATAQAAAAGGLVSDAGNQGGQVIFGLVPDGNASVNITPAGTSQQSVPVEGSTVVHVMPVGPATDSFTNANGAVVSASYTN